MPGMVLPNSRLAGERSYIYEEIDLGGQMAKKVKKTVYSFSSISYLFQILFLIMFVCI